MHRKLQWIEKYWPALLLGMYTLLILYTTLVPFRFSRNPAYILRKMHRVDWHLYIIDRGIYSGSDILINVFLFVPLGFLAGLAWTHQHSQMSLFKKLLLFFGIGALISTSVETLQIFTYNRNPSLSDIFNNTMGSLLGGLVYLQFQKFFQGRFSKWARHFLRNPHNFLLLSGGTLSLLFYFAPFDFALNLHALQKQWLRFLNNPWQMSPAAVAEWLFVFSLFTFLSLAFHATFSRLRYSLLATTFPILLEALQLALPDRQHSLLDALVGILGWLLGYMLTRTAPLQSSTSLTALGPRRNVNILSGLTLLAFGYTAFVLPFLTRQPVSLPDNLTYYFHPWLWILRRDRLLPLVWLMVSWSLFLPLGFLGQALFNPSGKTRPLWPIGLSLIVLWQLTWILTQIQQAQALQVIMAMLGIWSGRVWMQTCQYLHEHHHSRAQALPVT